MIPLWGSSQYSRVSKMRIRASNSTTYPPLIKTLQTLHWQHFLPDTCGFSWLKANNLVGKAARSLGSPATPSSHFKRSPGQAHHASSWRGCVACACVTWYSASRSFPYRASYTPFLPREADRDLCNSLQHLIIFENLLTSNLNFHVPFYLFFLWPRRFFCLDPLIPLIFIVSDYIKDKWLVCVILQV